jgi:RNA polymerase sigma-70 factor (ECF subfamily)
LIAEVLHGGRERDMADGSDQWASWLDQHLASLVLLARQWVPSRADAEDVVQEAFVRFWRARERVADPAAYCFACVKHVALDWRRQRKRQARREKVSARPEVETWFAGPGEQNERRAALESALRHLPESQREVLVMRIWGELSFPQIAAALEIPADTVRSRYRYALDKLREHLVEETIP